MKRAVICSLFILLCFCSGCSKEQAEETTDDNMVYLPEGSFYIGKYEVTQKEWTNIMQENPSSHKGDNLPVENVSWYQCIEYCNKLSEKNNLENYYIINKDKINSENKNELDNIKWTVTINEKSKGYRLPTEKEWILAAQSGHEKKEYVYSGGDNADDVGWTWKNSGEKVLDGNWNWNAISGNKCGTHEVGKKTPNQLGIYDMSGNVREWCFDWYEGQDFQKGYMRVCKGGGWMGDIRCCEIAYRGKFDANGVGSDQGFRLCKNK